MRKQIKLALAFSRAWMFVLMIIDFGNALRNNSPNVPLLTKKVEDVRESACNKYSVVEY